MCLWTPDGTVLNKRDVIENLFSPAYEIDDFENTDIDVRVFGMAAVVVARGSRAWSVPGQRRERTIPLHARLGKGPRTMACGGRPFLDASRRTRYTVACGVSPVGD